MCKGSDHSTHEFTLQMEYRLYGRGSFEHCMPILLCALWWWNSSTSVFKCKVPQDSHMWITYYGKAEAGLVTPEWASLVRHQQDDSECAYVTYLRFLSCKKNKLKILEECNNQKMETIHMDGSIECSISIQWNIIQHQKGRKFWHMQQHGWSLKTLWEVEQASHKRTNIVWFYLYKVPRVVRFIETESRMMVVEGWGQKGMGS